MFESSLKLQTSPFFCYILRVVPRQMFKCIHVLLHCHISLLQCEELCLPVLPGCVRETFLQEPCPEASPLHLFISGLHLLLHTRPPILNITIQKVGGKKELLLIRAAHHREYLLTRAKPGLRFIRRCFASELSWLMA